MRPDLYAHQRTALGLMLDRPVYALTPMEMGTGKSPVIAHEVRALGDAGRLRLAVVVAPDGVHRKWAEREFPLHGEVPAFWLSSDWRPTKYAKLRAEIRRLSGEGRALAVCLGYGACSQRTRAWSFAEELINELRPAMLVLDESQKIKNHRAVRTKALTALGKRARYRRILSGTPLTRGFEDLFSQWRFLDPEIIGARTYTAFRSQYCVMGGYEFRKIVNYQNVDQLLARIAPHRFGIKKSECLDLPEKTYERVAVDLSPEQRHHYDLIKDEFLLQLDRGDVDLPLAITRMLRLQQVIGGHVGERNALEALPCPRLDVALELIEEAIESDQQVIVWARFRAEIDRLRVELAERNIPARGYHGGLNERDAHAALSAFQEARTARVLVATQAKGGAGIDLTAASTVIYYSNTFNYEDRAQSEDRAHRIGQTRSVAYHDLVCPGTLDTKILAVLAKRRGLAEVLAGSISMRELLDGRDDDYDVEDVDDHEY